ncbi:MAG: Ribonuclease P protein component [Parcubacteria group bacterium GW2011_GWC2_39_14]|nr:MAG: Ribonuclease P protein component [Parcubacteria group bacterium GW2011_GWC2_39_14]KKR55240.1 MAG: Ribonuclease P protein component [Parcubacteria group bacterium GW2011_GWA2_40_23]
MLQKIYRITKQLEFDAFFGNKFKQARGRNFSTANFIFKSKPNGLKNSRFGFVISNKIDNRAVVRNRLRRYTRETIRLNLDKFKQNLDCLIVFKKGSQTLDHEKLEKEILGIFKTIRLL